jgi:hypothetical protein
VSVAIFQLEELGGDLASAIPELSVGPWSCAPAGLVAFDAGIAPPAPRWRVGLGRDDAANQLAFAGGERSVAHTHAVLDDVPRRLDSAIDRALAELARGARDRAAAAEPAAESRLLAALVGAEPVAPLASEWMAWEAEPEAARSTSSSAASDRDPGRLERTLARIADLARGRARIETQVEGAIVAHSMMTLSGDTEVWITPRLSVAGARLHARSAAVATRTRHAWARILTLIVRGCARLAALGLPAAGVAALPVVWRFLRDLLREARALRAAQVPA